MRNDIRDQLDRPHDGRHRDLREVRADFADRRVREVAPGAAGSVVPRGRAAAREVDEHGVGGGREAQGQPAADGLVLGPVVVGRGRGAHQGESAVHRRDQEPHQRQGHPHARLRRVAAGQGHAQVGEDRDYIIK